MNIEVVGPGKTYIDFIFLDAINFFLGRINFLGCTVNYSCCFFMGINRIGIFIYLIGLNFCDNSPQQKEDDAYAQIESKRIGVMHALAIGIFFGNLSWPENKYF